MAWMNGILFLLLVLLGSGGGRVNGADIPVTRTGFDALPKRFFYFKGSESILWYDESQKDVWLSDNGGKSWDLAKGIEPRKAVAAYEHPTDGEKAYVFTEGTTHYYTTDRGQSWNKFETDIPPSTNQIVAFHAERTSYIIYMGRKCTRSGPWMGQTCHDEAFYTTDNFQSTHPLLTHIQSCMWSASTREFDGAPAQQVICLEWPKKEDDFKNPDNLRLVVSDDYFGQKDIVDFGKGEPVSGVIGLGGIDRWVIAARKAPNSPDMALFITENGKVWHEAVLPQNSQVNHEAFTILESSHESLIMDVTNPASSYGTLHLSNSNGTFFSKALEWTNRNEFGFVDFERIQGVEGIMLANVVDNPQDDVSKKRIRTKISFDEGRRWQFLNDVRTREGEKYKCETEVCSLSLHSVTDDRNIGAIFSASGAPGIVMGVGSVGDHLKDHQDCDTFLSTDGGITWRMVLEGPHKHEFADMGGIIVAAKDSNAHGTSKISWSADMGKTWEEIDLGFALRTRMVTTDPRSTSRSILVAGIADNLPEAGNSLYQVVHLDFTKLFDRQCQHKDQEGDDNDFEKWYARDITEGKDCLMGHEQAFWRKKADARCYVGHEFGFPKVETSDCPCVRQDYECDYNFVEENGECKQVGPDLIGVGQCKNSEGTYLGSNGLRLIPGNTCDQEKGLKLDEPVEKKCSDLKLPAPDDDNHPSEPNKPTEPGDDNISGNVFTPGGEISRFLYFKNSRVILLMTSKHQLWISETEGITWKRVLEDRGDVHNFWMHEFDDDRAYVLAGEELWATQDQGQNWFQMLLPAKPNTQSDLVLDWHPTENNWLLFFGESRDGGPHVDVYVSWDHTSNLKWELVDTWVTKCIFGRDTSFVDTNKDSVFCSARAQKSNEAKDNQLELYVTNDWGNYKTKIMDNVVEFFIVENFMAVAREVDNELRLHVSQNGRDFKEAQFPPFSLVTRGNTFTILQSNTKSVMLNVFQSIDYGREYGALFKSDDTGVYYHLSLNYTNGDGQGTVDFEKMQGIQGVALANQVINSYNLHKEDKKIRTHISWDDGNDWQPIDAPAGSDCVHERDCYLNLHSRTDIHGPGAIYSATGSPGLAMGVGNIGSSLTPYEKGNTYLTRDGGHTWTLVRRGEHLFEFGDQGSLLAMVTDEEATDELLYSWDQGETWQSYRFVKDSKIRVNALTTDPKSSSLQFLIVGVTPRDATHQAQDVVISVDFSKSGKRACKKVKGDDEKNDFEAWVPKDEDGDDICVLGQKISYWRRKKDRICMIGDEGGEPEVLQSTCACRRNDFECDFGFWRDWEGKCVLHERHPDRPKGCKPGSKFKGRSGYKKNPNSVCEGGENLEGEKEWDCEATAGVEHTKHEFEDEVTDYIYFDGSDVIFLRTADGKLYRSDNDGYSMQEVMPGTHFDSIVQNPFFPEQAYFLTDGEKHYYTKNHGADIEKFDAPAKPERELGEHRVLSFHAEEPDWLIYMGQEGCDAIFKTDCRLKAYYSQNGGATWESLSEYVYSCSWGSWAYLKSEDKNTIFCLQHRNGSGNQRQIDSGPKQLLISTDHFESQHVLFDAIVGMAVFEKYMIVAEVAENALRLQISLNGLDFAQAQFPPDLEIRTDSFTLMESVTSVWLHVTTNAKPRSEYGIIFRSNSNGTYYVVTLEDVNRNSKGIADFEKMQGIEGIAVANQVINPSQANIGETKKLRSKITWDDGGSWHDIPKPDRDVDGKRFDCSDCSLHFHSYSERRNPRDLFSASSAVGLMVGVGNVGSSLSDYNDGNVYLTRDAGKTWKEVHKDAHLWEFGDQGSILVIVNDEVPVDTLSYSTDEGNTWTDYKFADEDHKVRVSDIISHPNGLGRNFLLLAKERGSSRNVVYHINFSGLYKRKCVLDPQLPDSDDFELWSPADTRGDQCLFGRETKYYRKNLDAACYIGDRLPQPHEVVRNCTCTRQDFECAFNYIRNSDGHCVLAPNASPPKTLTCEDGVDFYYEPTPYRKLPISSCEGGAALDEGKKVWCPGRGISSGAWAAYIILPFAAAALVFWYLWNHRNPRLGPIRLGDGAAATSDSLQSTLAIATELWVRGLGCPITRLKSSLQEFEDCFKAFTTPSKSVGSVSEECASQQTFAYDAMTGHLIVPSLNSSRHTNESIQEVSAVFVAQEPHSSMEHNYDLRITQASAGLRILHNFDSNATFLEYLMYTLRREPAPSLQEYYEDMVDSDYKSKIRRDEDRRVVSMMVFKKGSKVQSKSVSGANSLVWPDEAYLYVAEPFMPNPLSTVDAPGDEESEAAQMVNPSTHGLHRNDASVCEDSEKSKQTPCMRVFAVPDNEPLIVNHLVLQYSRCFESLHVHFPSLMRKFWTGSLSPILINSICAMYALHTYVTHRAEAPPTDNNTISDQAHRTWEFGHRVEQHFLRKTRVFLEDAFDVPHIDTVSALLNLSHCYLKYTRGDTPDYTAYVNAGASDMISKRTDKSRLYLSMAVAMIRSLCVYDQHGRMVDINLEDTADTFEREDAHRLFWSVVTMDAALNADPYKDSAWTILNDCFDDRVRIPSPTVMPDEGEEASMAIARFWYARRIGRDGFAMHRRIAIDLFQRISTAAGGMWGTEITQLVDMIIQELDDYDKVRPPMLRSWPNRKYERPECLIHVVLTDLDMMMKKMMLLQGYFGESDDLLKELTSKMYSTHTRIKRAQKSTSANTSSTSNTNLDISSSTTKTTDLSRTDADATFPTFLKKKLYWGAMPEQPIPSHSACHANRIQGSISEQDIKNAVAQGRFIDIALQICFDVAQHFSELDRLLRTRGTHSVDSANSGQAVAVAPESRKRKQRSDEEITADGRAVSAKGGRDALLSASLGTVCFRTLLDSKKWQGRLAQEGCMDVDLGDHVGAYVDTETSGNGDGLAQILLGDGKENFVTITNARSAVQGNECPGADVSDPFTASRLVMAIATLLSSTWLQTSRIHIAVRKLETVASAPRPSRSRPTHELQCSFSLYLSSINSKLGDARSRSWLSLLSILFHGQMDDDSLPDDKRNLPNFGEFYDLLQPPVSPHQTPDAQPVGLLPTLLPFQTQAVAWMLQRENKMLSESGALIEQAPRTFPDIITALWRHIDTDAGSLWVNPLLGIVTNDLSRLLQGVHTSVRGGILCEEMGLGKTVEMLGLIMLHRPSYQGREYVLHGEVHLLQSRATLIITPPAILQQWATEISKHAPGIKVIIYDGIRSAQNRHRIPTMEELADADIVLTTYTVLSFEVAYSRDPPDRSRRFEQRYVPPRSPLVKINWWRCVLDEAQMIDSPISKSAEMARLIPRVNAWAVTGTPITKDYTDLFGLFCFLDLPPIASEKKLYNRLITEQLLIPSFIRLCQATMYRNSKHAITSQLDLPKQHKEIVQVQFSKIEQAYYEQLWEQCCRDIDIEWLAECEWGRNIHLDVNDDSKSLRQVRDRIDAAKAKMRSWLHRLRQTCCHPGVGIQNQRSLGGTLRTVHEVLEAMFRQCRSRVLQLERQIANHRCRRAGMLELQRDFEGALKVFEVGLVAVRRRVQETREQLQLKVETSREVDDDIVKIEGHASSTHQNGDHDNTAADTSAGIGSSTVEAKAATEDEETDAVDSEMDEYKHSVLKKEKVDEAGDDVESITLRLHNWLEVEHKFVFYIASVYHELKNDDEETKWYKDAETIRREILAESEMKVYNMLRQLGPRFQERHVGSELDFRYSTTRGGLLSSDIIVRIDDLAEKLNAQRRIIEDWREQMIKLLLTKLVDQDADPDGEEYQESLDMQEHAAIMQEEYSKLIADRRFYLDGTWNALRLGDAVSGTTQTAPEEQSDFEKDLIKQRQLVAPKDENDEHMRMLVTELRSASSKMHATTVEIKIVDQALNWVTTELKVQTRLQKELEKEAFEFNKLYNARIDYFRQLQKLSDQVQVPESTNPEREVETLREEESNADVQLAAQLRRHRYLEHLMENAANEDADEETKICLICRETFIRGVLTYCGHMYCEPCITTWVEGHKKCPACNQPMRRGDWSKIAWELPEVKYEAQTDTHATGTQFGVQTISEDHRMAIQAVKIQPGYGAKLDTIVRHILYIKQTRGEKCVVFSQWAQVLDLLHQSLVKNGVGCVKFWDRKTQRQGLIDFHNDPNKSVFLLHARSQSSGLTLVAAHHIFMCEPLISLGLESQAINRVHRIGQTKETHVYWYICEDTIEERVHAVHERRKLESLHAKHARQSVKRKPDSDTDTGDEDATLATRKVKFEKSNSGGGEFVVDDDLELIFAPRSVQASV
ncbi:hypothetical protein BZG36_03117 [Bifiguratus adelaidae]|uniref:Vacuolar protein sorting/targeting protein 10 n=1 Tax=Bifiguratus adelaidae TaxID=1938954 RepID=A0A261Y0L5_9FUNG|nr:hypothetical protein BZG36_03117 [Bifiguratus adelaidae]